MLYFKHSDLVDKYHVSLKTVHNWIDAAKRGKLDLRLHEIGSRTYIANTASNLLTLEELANNGKKYRNTLHRKTVRPTAKFYEIYSRRQILDIISNITIHREIPSQYGYVDGGAQNWMDWVKRLESNSEPSNLNASVELLEANQNSLDLLLQGYESVNIIDIGIGNARPARTLTKHLLERGLLNRYIGVDVSKTMLDMAGRNIAEWFDGQVRYEGHVRDFTFERFDDLLVEDMLSDRADKTINLFMLMGGTLTNFRSYSAALKVVHDSMGADDLIIYTEKTDTEASRRHFDFGSDSAIGKLAPGEAFVLGLLDIDRSLYEAEMGFDQTKSMRYVRIRLRTALQIEFEFGNSKRTVNLEKGDTILLLRVLHLTSSEIISRFQQMGFTLLQSTATKDRQYLLTVSAVDRRPEN